MKFYKKYVIQSSLIKSLTFQSSKLPSGRYRRIINGILSYISSFSAIYIGSISSQFNRNTLVNLYHDGCIFRNLLCPGSYNSSLLIFCHKSGCYFMVILNHIIRFFNYLYRAIFIFVLIRVLTLNNKLYCSRI